MWKTHGMRYTTTYSSWHSMKVRCLDNKNKDYKGRGIGFCEEWNKFENFYTDMGDRPAGKTLDRIDNNKGYSKENCQWSTLEEQANNTRTNRFIEYNGKIRTVADWARAQNMNHRTLKSRLARKWSIQEALTKEVKMNFNQSS